MQVAKMLNSVSSFKSMIPPGLSNFATFPRVRSMHGVACRTFVHATTS